MPSPSDSKRWRGSCARHILSAFFWAVQLAYLGLFIAGLVIDDWSLAPAAANPLIGSSKKTLVQLGATVTYKITEQKEWWRIVSSPFLPAGTLHVWVSSSALWSFGMFLTYVMNSAQIIFIFAVSALAGVLVSANIAVDYVTSAASGPIFGLMGATAASLVIRHRQFQFKAAAWIMLAVVMALNVYMGATPFVDNIANTTGFVIGAITGASMLLLNNEVTPDRKGECVLRTLCVVLLGLVLTVIVLAVIGLNLSQSEVAGCCSQWSCINSFLWDCDAALADPSCTYQRFANASVIMYCPMGAGQVVVPPGSSDQAMLALCDSICA